MLILPYMRVFLEALNTDLATKLVQTWKAARLSTQASTVSRHAESVVLLLKTHYICRGNSPGGRRQGGRERRVKELVGAGQTYPGYPGPLSEVTVHRQTKVRIWGVIFKENCNGLRKAPRIDSELHMLTCTFFFLLLFSDSFSHRGYDISCHCYVFTVCNPFRIFYLNFQRFWREKNRLFVLLCGIENWESECDPVSTSWNCNPEP